MASNPAFVAAPKSPALQIANGDGTAYKTLIVGGSNGTRVDAAFVCNSDASNAYTLQVAVKVGSTDFPIGEVAVPAGSGTNGTAPSVSLLDVSALPALDSQEGTLYLAPSAELRVKAKSTVSGVNVITIVGQGGDY